MEKLDNQNSNCLSILSKLLFNWLDLNFFWGKHIFSTKTCKQVFFSRHILSCEFYQLSRQMKRSGKWQWRWKWLFCSRRSCLYSFEDISGFEEDLTQFFFLILSLWLLACQEVLDIEDILPLNLKENQHACSQEKGDFSSSFRYL